MKIFGKLLFSVCAVALVACASSFGFSKTQMIVDNISLKGKKIYIYSFLDIREEAFGPGMLNEFDSQFVSILASSGVAAKLLRFKDSAEGGYFARTSGTVDNPVRATVARNIENERKSEAQYRLTIEPISFRYEHPLPVYEIRWVLTDTKSGAMVWSTTLKGGLYKSPIAELFGKGVNNANYISDGIIQEMRASKLL